MTRLNQIIAVQDTKKNKAKAAKEAAYHLFDKPAVFGGLVKTYQPKDDDGEKLPGESQKVQYTVDDLLNSLRQPVIDHIDVVATLDNANAKAKANIELDGKVLLTDVPVTHLLFLEKQLNDFTAMVSRIPTLDQTDNWRRDGNLYKNDPVQTHRTKKMEEPMVLYPATTEHPAQTQVRTFDVIAGFWQTTKLSGAWDSRRKTETLERVAKLKEAVVRAREEANSAVIQDVKYGKIIVDFLLGA